MTLIFPKIGELSFSSLLQHNTGKLVCWNLKLAVYSWGWIEALKQGPSLCLNESHINSFSKTFREGTKVQALVSLSLMSIRGQRGCSWVLGILVQAVAKLILWDWILSLITNVFRRRTREGKAGLLFHSVIMMIGAEFYLTLTSGAVGLFCAGLVQLRLLYHQGSRMTVATNCCFFKRNRKYGSDRQIRQIDTQTTDRQT